MEKDKDVDKEEKTSENEFIEVTKAVSLNGQPSVPEDVDMFKCPGCEENFLAADVLFKDMGNNIWEPFCPKCKEKHLEIIH